MNRNRKLPVDKIKYEYGSWARKKNKIMKNQ